MAVIAILIFTGCFSKILIILMYNKFFEDSIHVADCSSELIKQIKLRYSNQIKLDLPIQDAEKFVSRYIYQYSKMIKCINVLDMFSLIVMLGGIALNYEKQYFGEEVLFIAMFIYLSIGLLVNGDKKERVIINNIADYLVNNMQTRFSAREHRVQVKENMREELNAVREKEAAQGEDVMRESKASQGKEVVSELKLSQGKEKMQQKAESENDAIIEAVLKEFLLS